MVGKGPAGTKEKQPFQHEDKNVGNNTQWEALH